MVTSNRRGKGDGSANSSSPWAMLACRHLIFSRFDGPSDLMRMTTFCGRSLTKTAEGRQTSRRFEPALIDLFAMEVGHGDVDDLDARARHGFDGFAGRPNRGLPLESVRTDSRR